MYAGNYSAPTVWTNGGFSIWPSANYDEDSTNVFLLQNLHGSFGGGSVGYLGFGSISGSPSNPTFDFSKLLSVQDRTWATIPIATNNRANFAPQLNTTNKVNLMDARMHSVIHKGGYVYAVHSIFVPAASPTRSILQYFKISPNGTFQRGEIDDGASFYAYPNVAVNDFGDFIIGYAKFQTNIYPTAAYRVKFHNKGQMGTEQVFAEGEDYYVFHDQFGRNRWGDYTTSAVAPSNGRNFWTLGQYALPKHVSSTLPETKKGRYALRWAKVELFSPTNDMFASAVTLSGIAGTNFVQMERLTRENGETNHFDLDTVSMWYTWTAPASGQVTFSSDSIGAVAVYTGTSVSNLTLVAQSAVPPSNRPAIRNTTFTASSGTTYRIAAVHLRYFGGNYGFGSPTITWNQPLAPFFVEQPSLATNEVVHGYSLTLNALAIGSPSPTYQWKRNGSNISGATLASYTIASMTSGEEGSYTVVASNSQGSAASTSSYVKYFPEGAQPLEEPTWDNGTFEIPFAHVVGYDYIVWGSTNLINWVPLRTNTVPFNFQDTGATNFPYRFYRSEFIP